MDYKMDSGWRLHPIGGDTGQAYMGTRAEERVFLKRNSSPFLAALSVEGITPRLIWTKRVGNGDVLTAQEWLNGRELNPDEMRGQSVRDILHRIHHSENLLKMLQKVKGEIFNPINFYNLYVADLPDDLKSNSVLQQAAEYVKNSIASIDEASLLLDWPSSAPLTAVGWAKPAGWLSAASLGCISFAACACATSNGHISTKPSSLSAAP